MLDFVPLDALVLHLFALLTESLVNEDDQIGQTLNFHIVFLLELFDDVMHFDAIFLEIGFLHFLQSYLGGLFCFDLLKLLLLLDEELNKLFQAVHKPPINLEASTLNRDLLFEMHGLLLRLHSSTVHESLLHFQVVLAKVDSKLFETAHGLLLLLHHILVRPVVHYFD